MTAVRGTTVDIATQDGTADAYLVHPDDDAAHPAVLFYMDAFGLRPHLRAMADRLAGTGYTVLVPNVFHRSGRTPVFDLPEFIDPAARPEIWDQILPVMLTLTPELALRDAAAYLDWLADSPRAAAGPVGITGYCMGARLALHTAGAFPERVAAVAAFTAGAWRPTPRTARTWRWPGSPARCTSATPTRTRPCRRSRSTCSTRHSPRRAYATAPRSTRAPRTATPRPTPPRMTPGRRHATGPRCWTCWTATCPGPGRDGGAFLDGIAVRPDAHGRGVGRRLPECVDTCARALGLSGVRLCTNASMRENQEIHPTFGYGVVQRRVDGPCDRIHYRRRLA